MRILEFLRRLFHNRSRRQPEPSDQPRRLEGGWRLSLSEPSDQPRRLGGKWRLSLSESEPKSLFDVIKEIINLNPALLAAAGLVIYVMVRAAYDAFYGELGVTPEEVGLNYALIVARAALGLVTYVIIAVLLLLAGTLLQDAVSGDYPKTPSAFFQKHRFVYAFLPLALVGIAFIYFSWILLADYFSQTLSVRVRWVLVLVIVLALGAALFCAHRLAPLSRPPRVNPEVSRPTQVLHVLLVLAVLALAWATPRLSQEWGEYKARLVRRGESPPHSPLYGVLDVRAEPVCISWISSDPMPLDVRRPFMYLGKSNGTTVLYDYYYYHYASEEDRGIDEARQHAERIPSGNLVISSLGERTSCLLDGTSAVRGPTINGPTSVTGTSTLITPPSWTCVCSTTTHPCNTTTTTHRCDTTTATRPCRTTRRDADDTQRRAECECD
jgi:hypothetical protein